MRDNHIPAPTNTPYAKTVRSCSNRRASRKYSALVTATTIGVETFAFVKWLSPNVSPVIRNRAMSVRARVMALYPLAAPMRVKTMSRM